MYRPEFICCCCWSKYLLDACVFTLIFFGFLVVGESNWIAPVMPFLSMKIWVGWWNWSNGSHNFVTLENIKWRVLVESQLYILCENIIDFVGFLFYVMDLSSLEFHLWKYLRLHLVVFFSYIVHSHRLNPVQFPLASIFQRSMFLANQGVCLFIYSQISLI